MSQIDQFLASLKRSLKAKNILYRDLAKSLDLSESSVKRILSSKSLSLERLEEICKVADLSFADVVKGARLEEGEASSVMTDDQESALADNPRLLHFFMMLQEGKSPAKIEKEYQITSAELKKYLFQLDRLNLIELHPRDKVKLKKPGSVRFRRDGAAGKVLWEQTKANYFHYDFKPEDYIRFSFMRLSNSSLAKFKSKLERMVVELQEEARFEGENEIPTSDIGILLSFRPWQYSYMGAIKRRS